jgi:hypothetical protein
MHGREQVLLTLVVVGVAVLVFVTLTVRVIEFVHTAVQGLAG